MLAPHTSAARPAPREAGADRPPASTRRYRILLTSWQTFGAGSIQSVQYLAAGLRDRGHEVLVATPAEGVLGRRLAQRGIPVEDFAFPRGWSLGAAHRLRTLVQRFRPDLVDAQESRDRKAAILAKLLPGDFPPLFISRRQLSSSFALQDRLYGTMAARVIAISHAAGRRLAEHGVSPSRIRIVHSGLDRDRLARIPSNEEIDTLHRRLGFDPGLPVIGVVSRRKDQETLLRAAARLGRPFNLLFVGIEADPALATLAAELPAGSRVAYTGFTSDVRPYWALIDLKVLTTLREGLSQALMESLSLGIPTISADAGGPSEVLGEGTRGLLYPPGDDDTLAAAIDRMLAEPGLRDRFRTAGLKAIRDHFNMEGLAARTEAVYAEVLEARGG